MSSKKKNHNRSTRRKEPIDDTVEVEKRELIVDTVEVEKKMGLAAPLAMFIAALLVFIGASYVCNIDKLGDSYMYDAIPVETANVFAHNNGNEKDEHFIYFYSDECPKCVGIPSIIYPVAERLNKNIIAYNIGNDPHKGQTKEIYGVEGLPTIISIKQGVEVDRIEGRPTKKEITDMLVFDINAKIKQKKVIMTRD